MSKDENYLNKCFDLALKGKGLVSPNPLVGCVITKDSQLIASGYHKKFGSYHAEVDALLKLSKNKDSVSEDCAHGATMYLNLEPCNHYGKQPPCTEAIIKAGIKHVIFSMKDPNPLVTKNDSIKILKKANVKVSFGLLSEEAKRLNQFFVKNVACKEPFFILKTASSLDGKIATAKGQSKWITSSTSRNFVQELRYSVDAVLVGANTIIEDNPELTVRLKDRKKDIYRIILDTQARIPLKAKVIINNKDKKTIIVLGENISKKKIKTFKDRGVTVLLAPINKASQKIDIKKLSKLLYKLSICSVLVEGGGTINEAFLRSGVLDEYYGFIAPKFIGGKESLTSIEGNGITDLKNAFLLKEFTVESLGEDILVHGHFK